MVVANWSEFDKRVQGLEFLTRLMFYRLNPSSCPHDFLNNAELNSEAEAEARAHWNNAYAEERCPMVGWDQLKREIDALDSCPIMESIAAAYQMAATGHPTSLSPLLDLIQKDPALTAQILIASSRLKKGEGAPAIEEPRIAVNLLGENRLASIGGSLLTIEERMLEAPPTANWPNFIMFQWGTARLAQLICKYLEMPGFEIAAYTAGLIHDLGKLLLIRLHPLAFQAIHNHASKYRVSFSAAEKVFLEADTLQLALHFAEKQGMPQRFCNVFRWLDNLEEADEDAELIAIVSLARRFCRQNQVGFNGENPRSDSIPLKETPEWKILSARVFLNFDLGKFKTQIERECLQLKRELRAN